VQGSRPRRRRHRGPEAGERGFVLIAAIWLLILAGTITAVLMLRSLAAATAAAEHQDGAERRLALESAIETMLADRLFNGQRSAWWLTPASGSIDIDGRKVGLRVTSESGRIDVNIADPALIEGALRGLGVSAGDRAPIVSRLQALRARKRTVGSLAELDSLIAGASRAAGTCLAEHLTYVSGLAEPRPDQISAELSRALSGRGGDDRPGEPEGGAALRIEASDAEGGAMIAIARMSGVIEQPLQISAWGAPGCRGMNRAPR
jgi:hypothetical protein